MIITRQVSNTSATDTETQFHMSSDSGSRVQLSEASKHASAAKMIPETQVKTLTLTHG